MPETVVRWCARCWAHWGGIEGGKFYIWEGIIYYTLIWDVLVPAGERVGAGEHLQRVPEVWPSQLGRWCQLGLLGLGFSQKKRYTTVDTTYLHTIYHF